MKIIPTLVMSVLSLSGFTQNPIVPPGIYMADPAAQSWEDGRLYLYCSVDEAGNWYCSRKYHVLSTPDMINWELHKNTFSTIGDKAAVAYNDNLLFAPDCMFKDGKYYLYYCQPDKLHAEGVAVSKSPIGPFTSGKPMDVGPYNQIDPGVFIDDDGQAYYVWGQFSMKMAVLDSSMTGLIEGSLKDSILTESEHYFHEGAFMTKRNGLYYLVYADMSRGEVPTCIGYATSSKPAGPYKYGGVIIDNDHSDPQCWNNHGSIAEYNGQWYVFYHRPTHNSRMMRKACVEPISFNVDGSIPEVEMTSQGAGPPLPADNIIDAARACWMFGNIRIEEFEKGNEALTQINDGDRAVFKYIDFKSGLKQVELKVKPGKFAGTIQLKSDYPWRGEIAQFEINKATENQEWITISTGINNITGIHALWLVFYSESENSEFNCSVDELVFR